MTTARLFVTASLGASARVALGPDEANYLGRVLRLPAGAAVRVFNGRDGEWAATIEAAGKRGMTLLVAAALRAQAAGPDLTLLFAPVKRAATDWIVEKAVELGAARLQPVLTRRTVAETVRTERLALIAREAAEQTERLDVPEVAEATSLARALDGWDAGRPILFADEAGDDAALPWGGAEGRATPILTAMNMVRTDRLAYLTGPEGGFDPEERRLLRSLPYVIPVSLGPRILRAETAVCAGLSVIQAAWGDWGGPVTRT